MTRRDGPSARLLARLVAECRDFHAQRQRGEVVPSIEVRFFAGPGERTQLVVVLCAAGDVATAVHELREYGVRVGEHLVGDPEAAIVGALAASGWPQETAKTLACAALDGDRSAGVTAGLVGRSSWGVAWAGATGAGALLVREP